MTLHTHFGFICPKCKFTIGANIGTDNNLNCPNCGTTMIPNEQATPWAMNVYCKYCNEHYGMVDSDKCPKCGQQF